MPGIATNSACITFRIDGITERRRIALKMRSVLRTERGPELGIRAMPMITKSNIFQPFLKKDNRRCKSLIRISTEKIAKISESNMDKSFS